MLLIITHADHLPGETERWKELLSEGADAILLRKPGWTEDDYVNILERTDPACYPRILIAQYCLLQQRYGLLGAHFSEHLRNSTPPQWLEGLRSEGCLLSTGIHHKEALPAMATHWDLLLLSPVFDSISKPGYKGQVPEGFHRNSGQWAVGSEQSRIIALGGVNQTNAALAKQMGFDGIALLGAVWQEPDKAVENFIEIKKEWNGNAHTL
jgi:thiamine-phosphate pyrophosphorylase